MKSQISHSALFILTCSLLACGPRPSQSSSPLSPTTLSEPLDTSWHYFGQSKPSTTPIVFAPGIVSQSDRYEFGCTLSKDGKQFYFGVSGNDKSEIYYSSYENGQWSKEKNMFPGDSISYNDPMFSADENRIYFISDKPLEAGGKKKDIDLWYVEKNNNEWSDPINVGVPINNHLDQYYSSFSSEGTLYFGSKDISPEAPRYAFDIYKSAFVDGQFKTPVKLPDAINTDRYEADVFIAPDESYMIFCSIRKDGLGEGDLYISHKDENGNWKQAKNMGALINSDKHELCPYVSPDGQYFFYTSNQDIYWVSSSILEVYNS